MKKTEWLYPCGTGWSYCKDGFCARYNELKEEHKRPAVEMSREWKETTGEEKKPNAITQIFNRLTLTKHKSTPLKQNFETCAISDLSRLVDSGKKFGTIYADPPWNYSNQATRAATDNHYRTMTVDEICALPVNELAAKDGHLHLWTTNAFIFETPKIFDAWGFHYKSIFVWVKPQMGIGNYWRISHEFLITAIRPGAPTFLDKSQMSWMQSDRTKHSRKPFDVIKKIEKVSPGPYLELFGRRVVDNWTVWGDEIERDLFNAAAFNEERL